jgi:hypothetical protein
MRDAGFKSLGPLVLSLMGASNSADGGDLLSAFKWHVKETGAIHTCPCMCWPVFQGNAWRRMGARCVVSYMCRSKVTHVATRHAPWKGMGKPFPLHPKPGAQSARGG